jgi:hypothetical protein
VIRAPRAFLRRGFFALIRKFLATADGRDIGVQALDGFLSSPSCRDLAWAEPGYPDLGRRPNTDVDRAPIFITARFRSGSTLLWNIFREVPGCTAYYEPLNERRWFDAAARGDRVDPSHHVAEYWTSYEGLSELGRHHDPEWTYKNLYMSADAWDPGLLEYIRILVARAPGRPVLQFNRIDFRLPWIRRHFPSAILVHLYRHPRDEWASAGENFYLREWVRDLKPHFPFLDETRYDGYELFYYLWRLSYAFGMTFADYSLRFEDLLKSPDLQIERLMQEVGIESYDLARLTGLVRTPRDLQSSVRPDWFAQREARCDAVLHDYFAAANVLPAASRRGSPPAGQRSETLPRANLR